jgi:hypothetical protein
MAFIEYRIQTYVEVAKIKVSLLLNWIIVKAEKCTQNI